MNLRLAGIIKESVVDGPGIRFVIFAQGCIHGCKNCHNSETWDPERGYTVTIDELYQQISEVKLIKGVTFSGGEPFLQAESLAALGKRIKQAGLDLVTYSGYTFEELKKKGETEKTVRELLELTDILIDGPYIDEQKDLNLPFRGSANQRILDVPKSIALNQAIEITIETKLLGEW